MENDVEKAQKGDNEAFTRLIKSVEGALYRVASSILRSDHEKLDAAQEAIMKAYVSLPTLNQPQFFKTWIIRILIRECTRISKSKKKIVPMGEVIDSIQQQLFEHRIELQEAVQSLDEDHRILIHLYYIEDLPVKEIAAILELQEGTIKSRLSRARKRLSELLGESMIQGGRTNDRV